MLITLQACPDQGVTHLSEEFKKDLKWFNRVLQCTDSVFIIHEEDREPICLSVDGCLSGCGVVANSQAYHMEFPPHIQQQDLSICHLEALNAIVTMKVWASQFANQLIHFMSDNFTAVVIFQARKGWNPFLQACTREIWLTCAAWDIPLAVGHVPGVTITSTAGALS